MLLSLRSDARERALALLQPSGRTERPWGNQVYMPGHGFIPLEVARAGGKRPAQNVGLFLVQE
jgi:hypothetical protein